ncbi:MAG: hypothetical protein ACJAVD_001089 [Porticoccaceae bacterium]|jgi:hypothetical protein|tara:strand:- start:269 stop:793 length:525 start_codon:yes stop_codon:yes gene_type:complete
MKKSILVLLITAIMFSCDISPKVEVVKKAIGHEVSDEGIKIPLYGGNLANVAVWENYIKAHNEKDFDAISNLNAEKDFKVYGPTGEVIEGTEAHLEFLKIWFTENNPKWKTNYLIANEFTNKDGDLRQWVTSGHELTFTIEGKEMKVSQVHDGLIVNGKIQMFYVNERVEADKK